MKSLILFIIVSFFCCSLCLALPNDCRQAIVGIADSWNDSYVRLSLLERESQGWKLVHGPFSARLGKSGLVWGKGIITLRRGVTTKREGDMRSPAGIFELGGAYGTVPPPQKKRSLSYRRIGTRDLWVDDPTSSLYNQHVILSHEPSTPWEFKQQMKLNDYAHSLKLFIKHNEAGSPGEGSSIFFHIWRNGGQAPTAGCTAMSEENLRVLIAWIDPTKHPLYILLPRKEYLQMRSAYQLP